MAIAVIEDWLKSSRNYNQGLKIFEEYSKNTFLKKLLADGEDEYNAQRLLKELQKLNESGKVLLSKKPLPIPEPDKVDFSKAMVEVAPKFKKEEFKKLEFDSVTSSDFKPLEVNALPEELQKLVAQKSQLWKKMCYLHSQLLMMPTDQERKEAAHLITEYAVKIQDIFDEVDYFREHKVMRPTTGKHDIMKLSAYKLLKRRNTLRTYISKANTGASDVTIDRVTDWKREMGLINDRLAKLEDGDD